MDLVQHNIAFREGYVLRSHLLHFVGRSAPNNFKEAVAPTPLLSFRQKWVNFKGFPERTSDLLQNPMQSIADVESKRPQLEREFRERERNFAQKKPNTLQRCSSVSQLNIALFATWSRAVKQLMMPASKQAWSAGICEPASPLWDVPRTATPGKPSFYHLPQEETYR